MSKFAKLYDINDDQVLVYVYYDTEEEKNQLIMRTEVNGLKASMELGFDSSEDAFKALDSTTMESSMKFREQAVTMLGS